MHCECMKQSHIDFFLLIKYFHSPGRAERIFLKTVLILVTFILTWLSVLFVINPTQAVAGQQVAVSATVSEHLTYFINPRKNDGFVLTISTNMPKSFSVISRKGSVIAEISGPTNREQILIKSTDPASVSPDSTPQIILVKNF